MAIREYWLCEGTVGAASRHGIGGMQCCGADCRAEAASLIRSGNCRSSADALTFDDGASA